MQSAIYVVLKELLRIEVDPNLFCSKSMLLQMEGSWLSCFSDLIVIWHIVIVQKVGSNPSWLSCSWSSDRRLLSPPAAAAAARPSPSSCSLQWATILPTVSIEIGRNLWKYSYCDISNLVKLSPPAAAAPPPSPAACSEPLFVLLWTWIESDRNCETLRAKMFWFWHLKLFSPPAWVGETGKCQRETIEHYWFMQWQGIQLFDWRQNCFRKWKKQKLYVNYLWTESVSN